jgi:hypothetical protein
MLIIPAHPTESLGQKSLPSKASLSQSHASNSLLNDFILLNTILVKSEISSRKIIVIRLLFMTSDTKILCLRMEVKSRARTVEEQFSMVRRGSGGFKAKVRRGICELFGFKCCRSL